jgi:hypothetical protein
MTRSQRSDEAGAIAGLLLSRLYRRQLVEVPHTAEALVPLLGSIQLRFFARGKVEHSTSSKATIGWTPKLRDVECRLKELRKQRRAFGQMVFVRQDGQPITYWGVASAWKRARLAAKVTSCTFHDIKAKALTDKERREGMQATSARWASTRRRARLQPTSGGAVGGRRTRRVRRSSIR